MPNAIPWTPGDRYGRLTVTGPESRKGSRGWRAVQCRCDCGADVTVVLQKLRNGHTRSCGCLQAEAAREHMRHAQKFSKGQRADPRPFGELTGAGQAIRLRKALGPASGHPCAYADATCKGRLEWASSSGEPQDASDYMVLCRSHHCRYAWAVARLLRQLGQDQASSAT